MLSLQRHIDRPLSDPIFDFVRVSVMRILLLNELHSVAVC